MIHSPFQRIAQIGSERATAAQMPWRTLRRTSRTEWRLRPSSMAISGEVAVTRPMPKIRKAKLRLVASAPAASASGPSQPIMITSVVPRAMFARLTRISGQASASVARASAPHALREANLGSAMSVMAGASSPAGRSGATRDERRRQGRPPPGPGRSGSDHQEVGVVDVEALADLGELLRIGGVEPFCA